MTITKVYESSGAGGNNGDSYFGGISDHDANKNNIAFTIGESGNQTRLFPINHNAGASGGSASTQPNVSGSAGISGACYITWPVSYRRRSEGTIEYIIGRGSLPRSGTIRFSDLAQLGTESNGSVRFSQYYRGSIFIPVEGIFSSNIAIVNSTQQRNLGSYRVSLSSGLESHGFRNLVRYFTTGVNHSFILPKGVRYLDTIVEGGGGGGGGYDSAEWGNAPGGSGANGRRFYGLLDLQVYQGSHNSTITVRIGIGGSGGFKSASAGGGAAVDTSNPLYGGAGGAAGYYGQSGGGGGGGGATWIMFGAGPVSSSTLIAVAGGGGGGGGQARGGPNSYKDGGSYYAGTLTTNGAPASPGTAGLNYDTIGYYEVVTVFGGDGAGSGGGGGGSGRTTAGGIGGGNQYAAPPVLYDDSGDPPPSSGGGY